MSVRWKMLRVVALEAPADGLADALLEALKRQARRQLDDELDGLRACDGVSSQDLEANTVGRT